MYKVGVIGTGFGENHLKAIDEIKEYRTEILCYHRDEAKAKTLAARYDIPRVTTDYREVIRSDVTLVVVVAPVYLHSTIVKEALAAGKHVVCDKPLVQGVYLYRGMYSEAEETAQFDLPGVSLERIGGLTAGDVEFVGAIDVNQGKVGKDLSVAIFAEPNNYPKLEVELAPLGVTVFPGVTLDGIPDHLKEDCTGIPESTQSSKDKIVEYLKNIEAEVLLYSLPTNCQQCANFYAQCALEAKVAFVNCTPDIVGRNPELLKAYEENAVPLVGDDLASQIGSSILQREILSLLKRRGINIAQSYQINVGGNMDLKNLKVSGHLKLESKKNALSNSLIDTSRVEVIPSAGILKQLKDHKVCFMNIEGVGWGGTPISIDLKLEVQDSSNAAGVIIDLIRIAAIARRHRQGGFPLCAAYFLKSPSKNKGGGDITEVAQWDKSFER